jgi:hypothetical protein
VQSITDNGKNHAHLSLAQPRLMPAPDLFHKFELEAQMTGNDVGFITIPPG